jgi:protoporphyrinogen oxidase
VPDLPADWRVRYDEIENVGVCCLVFKLRRSISPHFWVNVTDPSIPIPGIIEFSNLRPFDDTIVFVPYYMPVSHERWGWSDDRLIDEAYAALQKINPALAIEDRIDARVARLRYAQPIYDRGFSKKIPPIQTPIDGLQIADTCFYYPEDRGVSESVRIGRHMANSLRPA